MAERVKHIEKLSSGTQSWQLRSDYALVIRLIEAGVIDPRE